MIIDGNPEVEEPCMFERGTYLPMFYHFCYAEEISADVLEEKVSEDRYPELNEEEDTRVDDTRDENWRYVAEDGDDKKKIHDPRWEVYVKDK